MATWSASLECLLVMTTYVFDFGVIAQAFFGDCASGHESGVQIF